MKKIFSFLLRYKIVFILLFLIFLATYKVLPDKGILRHTDFFYPFNLKGNFKNYISAWDFSNFGIEASSSFSTLTNLLLLLFLKYLFPDWINVKILLILPLFLIGIFTYRFTKDVFEKFKYREEAAIISAIFSISNPVIYNYLDSGTYAILFSFAFAILFFHFLLKAIKTEKFIYIIYGSFTSIFINHLTIFALLILFVFIFLIFELLLDFKKSNLKTFFKFIPILFIFVFLLNSYWIVPLLGKFFQGNFLQETFTSGSDITWLTDMSKSARLFAADHLRHLPYGLLKNIDGFQIGFSYLLLVFILSTLILFPKDKLIFFFYFTGILFVILSLGNKKPLGLLFEFLWQHFAIFHGFRSTIRFLIMGVISYSILLGYFTIYLISKLESKTARSLAFTGLTLSIIFSCWPIYSGDCLGVFNPVKIPQSYYEIKKTIDASKELANILILPDNLSPFFSWSDKKKKALSALYFENNFFKKPTIFLFILSFSNRHKFIYSQIQEKKDLKKLFAIYNIGYIILHKDYLINNDFKKPNRNYLFYKEILESFPWIKLEKSFKEIDFYSIDKTAFQKRIYIPESIVLIDSKEFLSNLTQEKDPIKIREDWQVSVNSSVPMKAKDNLNYKLIPISFNLIKTKNAAYFLTDLIPKKESILFENFDFNKTEINSNGKRLKIFISQPNSLPQIKFKMLHPTKYSLSIKNAKKKFLLIFSESYHKNWKLFFKKKSIFENTHLIANGFVNGWLIDPKLIKKENFELVLEYQGQKLFYLGLLISFLGFLFLSLLIFYIKK